MLKVKPLMELLVVSLLDEEVVRLIYYDVRRHGACVLLFDVGYTLVVKADNFGGLTCVC